MNKASVYLFLFALLTLGLGSCVDQDFDEPPVGELPNLTANTTIAELKARHTVGSEDTPITDSVVIRGVVTADDESGNLFKQIVLEDETGGIILRLNANSLYNEFPVGREVFVKCQGLYVGDFNNLIQINGSPDEAIEEVLIPNFVIGGRFDQPVEPLMTTIGQITPEMYGRLIRLDEVQFAASDTAVFYADAVNRESINRTLEDCNGGSIIVRSSGFADFASEETPAGNGTLVAVLTIFGDTRQLLLRDLTDVQLEGSRCESGGIDGDLLPISELRDLFGDGETSGPEGQKIRGIVVSDKDAGNFDGRNLVLQDASAGIVVRFENDHDFGLGQEVEIAVGGEELSEFNGLLQVNMVPNSRAAGLGTGNPPAPRMATVQEILDNSEAWESTLVAIAAATITGSSTFGGSTTVSDATGSIPMFTRNDANFANQPLPAEAVDMVALVGDFNGPQLLLRNGDDVEGDGGGGGDPELIAMADLRDLYEGGATTGPVNRKIRGIVISDKDNENTTGRNVVLQDETGGLVVRFTDDHNFALGEDVEVIVSGMELSEFNGLFQVNEVPNGSAASFGNGTLPEPRVATVSEIIANLEEWESTLVLIENVTISGGSTFNGLLTVTDDTGSLGMFTRSAASFANAAVPSGTVNLRAVVSEFNDPQIFIRDLNDINP